MNFIAFVLMVYTSGGNWIPTIEFKTEELCNKAAIVLKNSVDASRNFKWYDAKPSFCVKIEK